MLSNAQYLVNEPHIYTLLEYEECLDLNIATNLNMQNENLILDEANMQYNYLYLNIIEQPSDTFRYRYISEGKKGSHGCIKGENSGRGKKTVPRVKVENCPTSLRDKIVVRVSLWTNEEEPKPHVYNLLDMNKRKNCPNGECESVLDENFVAVFEKIAISSVKKDEVLDILKQRKAFAEKDEVSIDKEVQEDIKNINLDSARLCFEAFSIDDLNTPLCEKVFSKPINNQKSTTSGDLKIDRLSRYSGKCSGGDEIFLLCEKVKKEDIKVHFFEKDNEGEVVWEGYGMFSHADVHHQFAIVFQTPKYQTNVHKSVAIELLRPSDGKTSEPREFRYFPDDEVTQHPLNKKLPDNNTSNFVKNAISEFSRKRRRLSCDEDTFHILKNLNNSSVMDSPKTIYDEDVSSTQTIGEDDNCSIQTIGDESSISTQNNEDNNMCLFQPGINEIFTSLQSDDMDEMDFSDIFGLLPNDLNKNEMEQIKDLSAQPFEFPEDYVYSDGIADQISTPMEHLSIADQRKVQKASNDFIDGITAMFQNRYHQFANQLVALEDENENSLLHLTILEQNQNWNLIKKILEVIPEDLVDKQNKFKETPLHLSIKGNHMEILLLLLMKGADPNILDSNGNNGLHLAAKYGHVKMIKVMLMSKKKKTWKYEINDINRLNFDGMSALHIAVTRNFEDCVTYLLHSKADVNLPEKKCGQTPLHLAVEHPFVLKTILKQPEIDIIDIYAEDFRGYTAVYLACLKTGKSFEDVSAELKNDKNKIIMFLGSINQKNEAESDWCLREKNNEVISDGHNSKYHNSTTESDECLTDSSDFEDALEDLNPVSCKHVDCKTGSLSKSMHLNGKKLTLMETEDELLKYLDINDNWKKVATLIDLPVQYVAVFDKELSPGRTVLKHFKDTYPDDSKALIEILKLAGLEEGVQIVLKNS